MNKWLYKGKEITDVSQFPDKAVGFVYMITNTTNGRIYIGKKSLQNRLTKKLTKKEISEWEKPGRVPKKKKVVKESNWLEYNGSNVPLLRDIESLGQKHFTKEVLEVCFTKKQLTYYEEYWQFKLEVLHTDAYNDSIAGRFFKRDVKANPELHPSNPEYHNSGSIDTLYGLLK
jgi:hypothetical protein